MTSYSTKDPRWSAAILKMSMIQKGLGDSPGFRVVYNGTLTDLGVTDKDVNVFITENRDALEAHIAKHAPKQ